MEKPVHILHALLIFHLLGAAAAADQEGMYMHITPNFPYQNSTSYWKNKKEEECTYKFIWFGNLHTFTRIEAETFNVT